jgi:pyruvate dehydrogenase E2 component (dihydrolipoamide acetyltransferase)
MTLKEITVPDIGDFADVEIIEVLVSPGDHVAAEDSLITLESDKASIEIPSTDVGTIKEMKIKLGDRISKGALILTMEVDESSGADSATEESVSAQVKEAVPAEKAQVEAPPQTVAQATPGKGIPPPPVARVDEVSFSKAYASPSVRRFARELGVDLGRVEGNGRKGRILSDDIKAFVKRSLNQGSGGLGVEPMPEVDFSQWGEVETQKLTRINQLTGTFLHRNWVTIPHVSQFDEADITDLEAFRKSMVEEYKDKGIKVTLLSFLMKAVVNALKEYPRFNASLDASGEHLILKKYFNIGVAVDTPEGLVVPVVRDVDRKSLVDLAAELGEISKKARDKKLTPTDMQGGCLTISSLGGIGGTQFTPIVNAPEVAILGVSRSKMQPVWNGSEFEPRIILPLSLSYDHRVIDGANGARFTSFLSRVLSDTRRLLL